MILRKKIANKQKTLVFMNVSEIYFAYQLPDRHFLTRNKILIKKKITDESK
jgi:hypothetical protein